MPIAHYRLMQDTGKFRTNEKDQFYTVSSVAVSCIADLTPHAIGTWVEPSAGAGAFVMNPDVIAMDIDPKAHGIVTRDFLTWTPPPGEYTVFGNPPFGRQSVLARKFIKHAATFASVIGFILPRSFSKPSMQRAFPLNFHLVSERELGKDSFLVNGEPYDVPCVFQVWVKSDTERSANSAEDVQWTYVKRNEPHDIAVRRVGGNAGRCMLPSDTLSVQSHYFIRLPRGKNVNDVIAYMNAQVFPSNTTGPRSLSKSEINAALTAFYAQSPEPV